MFSQRACREPHLSRKIPVEICFLIRVFLADHVDSLGTGDYAGWVKIVMDEKYGEILGALAAEGIPIDL